MKFLYRFIKYGQIKIIKMVKSCALGTKVATTNSLQYLNLMFSIYFFILHYYFTKIKNKKLHVNLIQIKRTI